MIRSHEELKVYRAAFALAMELFRISRSFPVEERFSLTDQMRRSSRAVCANLAEGWRKRRYAAAFRAKLSDAEAEAAETQTWVRFATECGYLDAEAARSLVERYDGVIGRLVNMINHPEPWQLRGPSK